MLKSTLRGGCRAWASCLAGVTLLAVAGCGYDPFPTPKPIVTGQGDGEHDDPLHIVQRATYESTPGRSAEPPALRPERSAAPIKPFEEWTEQEVAADTLGRIGAPAIPYLQQSLRHSDPAIRKQAAEVLGRMGSDAAPAVNDLTMLLDDPDPEVRKVAARTLGRIGPEAAPAVPALMRSLVQPEATPPALPPSAPYTVPAPEPVPEPLPLPRQ
jgi:hypothetical protein